MNPVDDPSLGRAPRKEQFSHIGESHQRSCPQVVSFHRRDVNLQRAAFPQSRLDQITDRGRIPAIEAGELDQRRTVITTRDPVRRPAWNLLRRKHSQYQPRRDQVWSGNAVIRFGRQFTGVRLIRPHLIVLTPVGRRLGDADESDPQAGVQPASRPLTAAMTALTDAVSAEVSWPTPQRSVPLRPISM